MTERFKSLILAIYDKLNGITYDLTEQGGVNALCNLIEGLNSKNNRLTEENKELRIENEQLQQELFESEKECIAKMTKLYELWFDHFDGTQANLNGYQKKIKVFASEDKAIEERDRLNEGNREKPYYIKEVVLDG